MDTLAIIAGGVAAERVRLGRVGAFGFADSVNYAGVAIAVILAWLVTLTLCGAYEQRHLESGSEEYRRLFSASLRFLAVVATLALVFKIDVARGFVAVAIPAATFLALGGRYAARRWLHRRRNDGRSCMRGVVVAGAAQSVAEMARAIRTAPYVGYRVLAACTPDGSGMIRVKGDESDEIPVVTDIDGVVESAIALGADAVAITEQDAMSVDALRALAWQLEGTGVGLLVAPSVTDVSGPRISMRPVTGLPLVSVEEPELTGLRRLTKGVFDRVLAATALVLLSPVLLVIGLAVRCTSEGPALFRQVRVGVRGRRFVIWKFRTMTVDAEARLAEFAHLNEHDGLLFKIANDPRVTRVGRVLRRWSLDELPQLWNVLSGEMSIVGPRPPLPEEVDRYDVQVRRRLLVKPGLTGLWQVSGRAGLPWDEAVRLDLHYVENWSPSLDAVILAKTILAVFRGHGAS
ncbi:MAG: sugar transferase [Nocardioides sp.]